MRILFVSNRYPTAATPGDSPCIAQQAQSLRELGHTVDVLWIASQQSRLAYITATLKLWWKVLLRKQYDIVHSHFGWFNALPAALQWRTPHVITLRGSDVMVPKQLRLTRPLVRRAAASIIMSDEMKAVLDEPAHVIPYGIDLDIYKPSDQDAARRELGLDPDIPLVLFPYDPARTRKRIDLVEAALNLLEDELPEINVVAIYDKRADEVATYMNACDVLLLTSNWEGSPSAVREAMACNLAVVSADVGDVRLYLDETDECHIAPWEPQAIADAIAPLLKAPRRTNTRAIAARTGLEETARKVLAVYEEVLQQQTTAAESRQTIAAS